MVETLDNLLALLVTAADEQDRSQIGKLAEKVQEVTNKSVELAFAILMLKRFVEIMT